MKTRPVLRGAPAGYVCRLLCYATCLLLILNNDLQVVQQRPGGDRNSALGLSSPLVTFANCDSSAEDTSDSQDLPTTEENGASKADGGAELVQSREDSKSTTQVVETTSSLTDVKTWNETPATSRPALGEQELPKATSRQPELRLDLANDSLVGTIVRCGALGPREIEQASLALFVDNKPIKPHRIYQKSTIRELDSVETVLSMRLPLSDFIDWDQSSRFQLANGTHGDPFPWQARSASPLPNQKMIPSRVLPKRQMSYNQQVPSFSSRPTFVARQLTIRQPPTPSVAQIQANVAISQVPPGHLYAQQAQQQQRQPTSPQRALHLPIQPQPVRQQATQMARSPNPSTWSNHRNQNRRRVYLHSIKVTCRLLSNHLHLSRDLNVPLSAVVRARGSNPVTPAHRPFAPFKHLTQFDPERLFANNTTSANAFGSVADWDPAKLIQGLEVKSVGFRAKRQLQLEPAAPEGRATSLTEQEQQRNSLSHRLDYNLNIAQFPYTRRTAQPNYQTFDMSSGGGGGGVGVGSASGGGSAVATGSSPYEVARGSANQTTPRTLPGGGSLRNALMGLQNPRLIGGDILWRTNKRRAGHVIKFERSALVSPVSLWPSGVIYFELDGSVAHLAELIWEVMQQFHDETCIRFLPRENNEPDFLRIEALKGCFSYIGRIGGEQLLSLGDGCEYKGTIAHELLHAVGFYHHQNRSDRDDFLEIIWENIAKGKENQFSKMAPQENILLNTFDYDSIMLYGPHTFGKTMDKVTMKPKREGVMLLEIVEKQGLSALDVDSVNKLYKCRSSRADQREVSILK